MGWPYVLRLPSNEHEALTYVEGTEMGIRLMRFPIRTESPKVWHVRLQLHIADKYYEVSASNVVKLESLQSAWNSLYTEFKKDFFWTDKEQERLTRLAIDKDRLPIFYCVYWKASTRIRELYPQGGTDEFLVDKIIQYRERPMQTYVLRMSG